MQFSCVKLSDSTRFEREINTFVASGLASPPTLHMTPREFPN